MQKAHLALWDAKVYQAADIFIYTQDEFDKSKELFNSIPEIVSHEGKEIQLELPPHQEAALPLPAPNPTLVGNAVGLGAKRVF